jgi:small ligand-binding sensory domain FIST
MNSAGLARANLVLAFATTAHGPGFTRLTRRAGEICGTDDVVGCSAAGVFVGERDVEGGPGVAVLAIQGDDLESRRFFVPLAGGADRVAGEIADTVGTLPGPQRLLVLFADSYNLEAPSLLESLARRLPGVPVVGGGASEDGSVGEVSVFAGNASSSHAVAGVALGGDIRSTVGVTHAVKRVGPVHRVTACQGNVVLALDDRPAYEAFANIVPAPLLEDLRRALAVVLVGLPVCEGEFVARHLVGVDPRRGALAVATPVAAGQELFFGVRDPQGARADLQRLLELQASAWSGSPPPAGALYVNCTGRGRAFQGMSGLDTAYIRQYLGPVPLAGFLSGAEFAPGGSACQLHQYTGVLVILGSDTGERQGGA